MTTSEDQERRAKNIPAIEAYLKEKFPGCEYSDDEYETKDHMFTLTDMKNTPYKAFKLRVGRPFLEDSSCTPEWTQAALNHLDIAGKMRDKAPDAYYYWKHDPHSESN